MPLTEFQKELAKLLANNRTPDSHLAGVAALHFEPNSIRYSNDLDYFHDSAERVNQAFQVDQADLNDQGYDVKIELQQPGYIRALVQKKDGATKVEWANDSDWRFMPVQKHPDLGYVLHPVDLAINKVLALVGRNEPRDFLDVLHVHKTVLSLGALCWAAAGKDPGFTPHSLLELLKRRGKYQQADMDRLQLSKPVDLTQLKTEWLLALEEAEDFINSRPTSEVGCLYYAKSKETFVTPLTGEDLDLVCHYGQPGGVLPVIAE